MMTMSECEAPLSSSKINDDEQQLIKLSLKKPKKWNWELTTSKSSSNIAFPTIQLYDECNKTLLAETNEANFTAGSKLCKSASVSKASSVRVKKNDSFSSLKLKKDPIAVAIQHVDDVTDDCQTTETINHDPNPRNNTPPKMIKNHHSRSSSVRSRSSILKRIREFSELNHAESSDDDETNRVDERINNNNRSKESSMKKKYSMRTCNIGTILVPKESFSKVARRRQRRNSADEASTGKCK